MIAVVIILFVISFFALLYMVFRTERELIQNTHFLEIENRRRKFEIEMLKMEFKNLEAKKITNRESK